MNRSTRKLPSRKTTKSLAPYLQRKVKALKSKRSARSKASRTRGWAIYSPKRGSQRHEMMKRCGKKCFLQPQTESFPICPYNLSKKKPVCRVDQAGVLSAFIRAKQWKYNHVATLAKAKMSKRSHKRMSKRSHKRMSKRSHKRS